MSENEEPVAPPQASGGPDDVETDPVALSSSEDLDQDHMQQDPLEGGGEPPEQWTGADQYGTTPYEQQLGEDMDQRLEQEQADDSEPEFSGSTRVSRADHVEGEEPTTGEDVDPDRVSDAGGVAPQEAPDDLRTPDQRYGEAADKAGGSVADSIREPPQES